MRIYIFLLALMCTALNLNAQGLGSLAPIETPNFSAGVLPDPTFPKSLEKEGDLTSALLEWKRIAHTATMDGDIERAKFNIARLSFVLNDMDSAAIYFEGFGKQYPKSHFIPEALYYMSRIWDKIDAPEGGKVYRARLLADHAKSPYTEKAYYHYLWARALTGDDILKTESLASIPSARGIELAERLKAFPVEKNDHVWIATGLGIIPGLGHAYLKDKYSAATACIVGLILLSAMFYSLKYRLWSFTLFFAMIGLTFYAGTIFSAHSLALRGLLEARIMAMKGWQSLHPDYDWVSDIKLSSTLNAQDIPLYLYRNSAGKVDGSRANGAPVNSLYARRAVEKHGLMVGSLFTVDRLVRDWRESTIPAEVVESDNRWRYADPLSRNDFWYKG
ncbi:MAG: hypothetical protein OSB62_03735 [Alphaproteobacteria bacterium]|nr:hypothetical protein [Alphaproteobacteria bacterium]